MEQTKKRKQRPKKGRVVRVTPEIASILAREQRDGEFIYQTLERVLGLPSEEGYILPSDLHEKIAQAKGRAILRAVREKGPIEKPIRVRRIE